MNNIYRVIWSALKQTYVAVNEKTGTAQSRGKCVKAVVTATLMTTALGAGATTVLDTGTADAAYYENPVVKEFFDGSYPKNGKVLTGDMTVSAITGSARTLAIGGQTFRLVGEQVDIGNVEDVFVIGSAKNQDHGLHIGEKGTGVHTTLKNTIQNLYFNSKKDGTDVVDAAQGVVSFENATAGVKNFYLDGTVNIDKDSVVTIENLNVLNQSNTKRFTNDGHLTISKVENQIKQGVGFFVNRGTSNITSYDALMIVENSGTLNADAMTLRGGDWKINKFNVNKSGATFNVAKTLNVEAKTTWGNGAYQNGTLTNLGQLIVGKTNDGVVNNHGYIDNQGSMTVNGVLNVGTSEKQYGTLVNNKNLTATNGKVYGHFDNQQDAVANFDKLEILGAGSHTEDIPFPPKQSQNRGTINVGEMLVSSTMPNDGVIAGKGDASKLTINVNDFSNGADAVIKDFTTMDVAQGSTNFLNFGRIENIGTLNIAGELDNANANDTQNGFISADVMNVQAGGKLHVVGDVHVGQLNVQGTVDEKSLTQGKPGTLTVTGGVTVNGGSLDLTNLSVGQLQLAEGGNGQINVDNLTLTGTGSSFGTDATFTNLVLNNGSDLALTGGTLTTTDATVGGTLTLGNGSLDAQNVNFAKDGVLAVTGQGSTIANLTGTNGKIDLADGSKLTINGGSLTGTHIVYNGSGDLAYSGKIEGAKLEYKNHNKTFTGSDKGFGANTVILDNSHVTFEGGATFTNEATITLGQNSKITADKIDFGTAGKGHLTMAGGTLTTNLGQIFASVDASNKLPAVDENGQAVEVPMSGITNVGAVKDTIKNGITYESGTFDFTDNGWTNMAVDSAVTNLGAAFGKDISKTTVVFSGQADATAKFDVAFIQGIQNNTNGLIFSDKVLDATGNQTLTFGKDGIKGNFGFKGIDTVESVTVADGQKLYLVGGTEGTYDKSKLLTGSQNGGTVDATTGTLVLGMADKSTHGMVDTVKGTVQVAGGEFLVNTLDSLKTAQVAGNATLHVGNLANSENGKLDVLKDGTLKLESQTAQTVGELVNAGTTVAQAALTVKKDFNNQGTFNGTSLTLEDKAQNNGQMTLTGDLASSKNFINTAKVEAQNATLAGLTNSGTMTLKGNLTLGDLGLTQTGGSITVADVKTTASKDVVFDLQGGKFDAQNIDLNATNGVQTLKVGADAVVTAKGDVKADIVNVLGSLSAKNLTSDEVTVANSMTLSGDLTVTNGLTMTAGKLDANNVTAQDVTVNGGVMTVAKVDAQNALTIADKATVKAGEVAFKSLKNAGTLEFTKTTDYTITDPATFTNEKTGVIKGLKTLTVNANGTNEGTIDLAQGGKLSVGETYTFTNSGKVTNVATLDLNGKIVNKGELAVSGKTTMGQLASIEQSANAVFATKDLEVQGNSFNGIAGTLKVENGLTFANDAVVGFSTDAKEMVFGAENLNGKTKMTYNIDDGKVLTFGKEHGLVDTLAKVDPTLAKANGTLVIGKSLTMGANGTVNVGTAPVTKATTTTPNLNVLKGSLTVVDASALTDNVAVTGDGATAKIEQGAKVAITRVTKDGDITLLKGFKYDASTVDADGKWLGGWTGADSIYVNDGSGLDYEVTTKLDANKNFVATLEMADVSTVYTDLAIKDIANAALKRGQKGGDVTLIQSVIRNDKLSVAEKTKIINSVAQMGATLGTTANFFADTTNLMDGVEDRASLSVGTGLWVKVEGGKYQQDGLKFAGNMEAGYDTNTYGFTFGADTQFQPKLRLGAAISYLDGSADAKGDALAASNDYQTFGIQGYGAYDLTDTICLIGTMGWFHSKNDMTQTIARADVAKAEAESDADAFTMSLRAEKAFDVNSLAVTPYVGLRAVYMMNDDFTTKVDGADAFKNDQDNTFTVQMPIGVAVSKAFDTASGWTLEPSFDVAIVPQFGDTDYDTTVTGAGTGVAQTLNADMAGNVLGQAKFGLRAINKQTELSASYGLTAGDAGRQDHAFTLGVSYKF